MSPAAGAAADLREEGIGAASLRLVAAGAGQRPNSRSAKNVSERPCASAADGAS